jgi:O-acetyl-ADP-ribose deacetylase (regulator of RNase III)
MNTKKMLLFLALLCFSAYGKIQKNFNNKIKLQIVKGDIINSKTQGIVNPANKKLKGGSGVCGVIFDAAGKADLQKACNKFPTKNGLKCEVGSVKVTDSFRLKNRGFKEIIHAVGPDCREIKSKRDQEKLLEKVYKSIIKDSLKHKLASVAVPNISCGKFEFPKEKAARIFLQTLKKHESLKKIFTVKMVLFTDNDYKIFEKAAKKF